MTHALSSFAKAYWALWLICLLCSLSFAAGVAVTTTMACKMIEAAR